MDLESKHLKKAFVQVILAALGIQFVLGMYVNLFVAIPHSTFSSPMMGFAGRMRMGDMSSLLMVHMMLGVALALMSLGAIWFGRAANSRFVSAWLWIGSVAILGAGWEGIRFFFNGQHNNASFGMAVGWAVASTAYVVVGHNVAHSSR